MATERCLTPSQLYGVYRHTQVPNGFMSSVLLGGMIRSTKERIEFDIERQNFGMAPFVRPCDEGLATMGAGFDTKWFRPAYVKMKDAFNVCDGCPSWYAGERPYSTLSEAVKFRLEIANILTRHRRMLRNRREWSVSRLAAEGSYNITYQGSSGENLQTFNMSYGRDSRLDNLVPAVLWNVPTAVPAKDLQSWINLAGEVASATPFMVIMGRDVQEHLTAHEDFNDLLNAGARIRASKFDMESPSFNILDGVTNVGRMAGIEYVAYSGRYQGADGSMKYYVQPNELLIVSRPLDIPVPIMTMMYGAIRDLRSLRPVDAFVKQWEENDPSVLQTKTDQAPLVAQLNPHLITRCTVLP